MRRRVVSLCILLFATPYLTGAALYLHERIAHRHPHPHTGHADCSHACRHDHAHGDGPAPDGEQPGSDGEHEHSHDCHVCHALLACGLPPWPALCRAAQPVNLLGRPRPVDIALGALAPASTSPRAPPASHG